MKYAWIASNATQLNIRLMCQLLGVSRSAYYDWLNASPCLRKNEDDELIKKIQAIFTQSRDTYGTRRMKRMLSQQNLHISRRRISRLMKQQQLVCKTKRKFKVTTDSKHQLPIAPHLLQRQFTVEQPNQCYVGDMTYIPTREGWLYLAVVIDLFSRQVVGWTMFLLDYISDIELREEITAETNKVEAYNGFTDWVSFGNPYTVIASNDPEEHEKAIKYTDIIANCIIEFIVESLIVRP